MNTKKLPIMFLLISFFMVALYVFSPSSQNPFMALLYLVIVFLPGVFGLYALRTIGIGNAFGRSVLLVTIGIWFWIIAECVWYYFNFILYIDPYPSIADVFFLIPYPIFFAGIILAYKNFGSHILHIPKKLLFIDACLTLSLSALVLYFGVYLAYDPEVSALQNGLSISYGVADLVIVLLSLMTVSIVREYSRSRFGYYWMFITLGFSAFLLADVLFAIFNVQHGADIKPYTYIDLLWLCGYLLFSYALLDITSTLKRIHGIIHEETSGVVSLDA